VSVASVVVPAAGSVSSATLCTAAADILSTSADAAGQPGA
jgi:hypothetical protein